MSALKNSETNTHFKSNVYLSRRDMVGFDGSSRRILYGDRFYQGLDKMGVRVLDPGGLTHEQKLTVLSRQKTVMFDHGAGMSNMIYLAKGGSNVRILYMSCPPMPPDVSFRGIQMWFSVYRWFKWWLPRAEFFVYPASRFSLAAREGATNFPTPNDPYLINDIDDALEWVRLHLT